MTNDRTPDDRTPDRRQPEHPDKRRPVDMKGIVEAAADANLPEPPPDGGSGAEDAGRPGGAGA